MRSRLQNRKISIEGFVEFALGFQTAAVDDQQIRQQEFIF